MLPDGFTGWDVGGAHLKAASIDREGRLLAVLQLPCPLWKGLNHLTAALDKVLETLPATGTHAVTMTGELVDLFENRTEGVNILVECLSERLGHAELWIYAGDAGLVSARQSRSLEWKIASANWLASATYLAGQCDQALFVDIGSTTTDIVSIRDGHVQNRGYTDAQRLQQDELLYMGVVRTPVMAITDRVPFDGQWQNLAAECFATMADVHRLTGELAADADLLEPADQAGKTPEDSARRLARMVGRDYERGTLRPYTGLARYLAAAQLERLWRAVARTLSRGELDEDAPLIGAGTGRFLVQSLARALDNPYRDFARFLAGSRALRARGAICAPAVAMAALARRHPLARRQ